MNSWPSYVSDKYKAIRSLGQGGFGAVYAAEKRTEKSEAESDVVAIKMIDTFDPVGKAYAEREIKVLSQLDHPNINKLLEVITDDGNEDNENKESITFLALSLADGPTLEQILLVGGAVGLPFAQFVTRELVSAVAYLHNRAVIHRDLKPDNVIVVGADLYDDPLWDDGEVCEKAVKNGCYKCILIDFGFVRGLGPNDVKTDIALNKMNYAHDANDLEHAKELASLDEDNANFLDKNMTDGGQNSRGRRSSVLDRSISRVKVRNLSAVGNRNYAAPEIINKVRRKTKARSTSLDRSRKRASRHGSMHGRSNRRSSALTDNVSDYGMVADAFSLGATIRYALTGVPPGNNVDEYISQHNNLLMKFLELMFSCGKPKKSKKQEIRFRKSGQCPKDAILLIRGLTHWDPKKRTTVRAARYFPWVIGTHDENKIKTSKEADAEKEIIDFLEL